MLEGVTNEYVRPAGTNTSQTPETVNQAVVAGAVDREFILENNDQASVVAEKVDQTVLLEEGD